MTKRRRTILIVVIVLIAIPLAAGLGFVLWANNPLPATPEAIAALESDATVTVTQGDWITFAPTGATPATGLIFYPGGRVDPRAYAPPLRALAANGYYVALMPMPLNLAVFGVDRANAVVAANPQIERWALGGHSLGGAMSAAFIDGNPGVIDGLFFWAAFPAGGNDLSDQPDLHVASIYGTLDGLATVDEVLASQPLLPASATFVPIEGGNHAQFGSYGDQPGDNPATISRAEQQAQAVTATAALLADLAAQ